MKLGSTILFLGTLVASATAGCDDDETTAAGGASSTDTGGSGGSGGSGGTGATAGSGGQPNGGGGAAAHGGTGGSGGTAQVCGNGTQEGDEECDDGDLRSHDGCSSGCTDETLTWTELAPGDAPTTRVFHKVAYDPGRDRVVLFGGTNGYTYHNDIWEYDGDTWEEIPANWQAGIPPVVRSTVAMTYRPDDAVTVFFGGKDELIDAGMNHTYSWDGALGSLITWVIPPERRFASAIAWDAVNDQLVLFGGVETESPATYFGDTWHMNGWTWNQVYPAASPGARHSHGMVFHAAEGVTVLFGGRNDTSDLDDTWEYDGTTWSPVATATAPSPRYGHRVAYDSVREVMVLFGGSASGVSDPLDTWEYDGSSWTETTPSTTPPNSGDMAYDSLRRRVIYAAYQSGQPRLETWAYQATSAWPDEQCDAAGDEDTDGVEDCADPDCEGMPCNGGTCLQGTCQ